jgi:hypothetical protein
MYPSTPPHAEERLLLIDNATKLFGKTDREHRPIALGVRMAWAARRLEV